MCSVWAEIVEWIGPGAGTVGSWKVGAPADITVRNAGVSTVTGRDDRESSLSMPEQANCTFQIPANAGRRRGPRLLVRAGSQRNHFGRLRPEPGSE